LPGSSPINSRVYYLLLKAKKMATLQNNRLSVILAPEQLSKVNQAFAIITENLPFLTGLTTEERQVIPKINTANKVFVEDSLNAMKSNAEVLPAYLKADELEKDLTLFTQLDVLVQKALQLYEKLSDTQMLAGSEAYISSLTAYRLFEAASKAGLPGSDTVYDQLKQRFADQGGQGQPATPPAPATGNAA
jgi:hypothetical protein